ncbi:unnamed protein product [Linum trigynum]|uniref:Uncharacterized protein n=1 Tax=Linum trigynum TaxID=586398 RepID=A0AAV2FT97_9ROSI
MTSALLDGRMQGDNGLLSDGGTARDDGKMSDDWGIAMATISGSVGLGAGGQRRRWGSRAGWRRVTIG